MHFTLTGEQLFDTFTPSLEAVTLSNPPFSIRGDSDGKGLQRDSNNSMMLKITP